MRCILFLGAPYKSVIQLSNLEVTKACTKLLVVSILRNFVILQFDIIEWKAGKSKKLLQYSFDNQ